MPLGFQLDGEVIRAKAEARLDSGRPLPRLAMRTPSDFVLDRLQARSKQIHGLIRIGCGQISIPRFSCMRQRKSVRILDCFHSAACPPNEFAALGLRNFNLTPLGSFHPAVAIIELRKGKWQRPTNGRQVRNGPSSSAKEGIF